MTLIPGIHFPTNREEPELAVRVKSRTVRLRSPVSTIWTLV
jgi:hypothetical protein